MFRSTHFDAPTPQDRRGRDKRERYTTKRLSDALTAYVSAARAAETAVDGCLRDLAAELGCWIPALRAALAIAEVLIAACRRAAFASIGIIIASFRTAKHWGLGQQTADTRKIRWG